MPQRKKTPEQKMKDLAGKQYKPGSTSGASKNNPGRPTPRVKKSKSVNTPGEGQRAFKGRIDHMISKAEGEFNKMIKNFRAKTRS